MAAPGLVQGGIADPEQPPVTSAPPPDILFAVDAHRGTFRRIRGEKGIFRLTLYGVHPLALWFEDRPGNKEGIVRVQRMLDRFYAKPGEAPPNAAVNACVPELDDQVLLGVKLLHGSYDKKRRILRFRAQKLKDTATAGGTRLTDATLPARFEDTALFIDSVYNNCQVILVPGAHTGDALASQSAPSRSGRRRDLFFSLKSASKGDHDDWTMYPAPLASDPAASRCAGLRVPASCAAVQPRLSSRTASDG